MRFAQAPPLPAFEATVRPSPDHVRALEAALVAARAGEERFRGLVESIQAIPYIANWDEPGTILYISPQVETLLGYPPEQWYEGEDPWAPNIHPDDRERVLAEAKRTFEAEEEFQAEYRIVAADGRVVWIAERETHVRDADGEPCFSHGVMFDITRLKTAEERLMAAEAALREERDLARRYFDVARTLLLVLDADGRVRQLNHHGHELLGHPAGALVGRDWFDVAHPDETRAIVRATFMRAIDAPPSASDDGMSEWIVMTAAGERRTISWRHTPLRGPDGAATGVLASGEDITDRLKAEAEIRRLAYHDALTGLPNRTRFDAELRAAVGADEAIGLLYLDLDDFKVVNDRLGHTVGDELLRAVAERLAGVEGAGMLGRHGGDEFLVLLRGLPADRAAATCAARAVADTVTARLGEPFEIAGRSLRVRASVGVAVSPHDAADADGLLRHADAAMYRAKGRSSPLVRGR